MNYSSLMKDCISYIRSYAEENLTVEELGKVHSLREEYISYIFSCYYMECLDSYMEKVERAVEQENGHCPFCPRERKVAKDRIDVKCRELKAFSLDAVPVVNKKEDVHQPIEAYVRGCCGDRKEENPLFALWWHDEEYQCRFMQGNLREEVENYKEESELIHIPQGRYAVFSMKDVEKGREDKESSLVEDFKSLILYAHKMWLPGSGEFVDEQGYTFHCLKDGKAFYCLALKEEPEEEKIDKVYGVETWIDYIDNHLNANLTVTSLAKRFNYSATHFKRVFRMYYKMSVADYIRKRRLTVIAEKIRMGVDYMETAALYGFKTYTGFARAFKKEFHVSPAVYKKGMFEVIDLKKYYNQYKHKLRLSIVELDEIKMIGKTIIPAKGAEVDIPAQVSYWIGKDYPGELKSRTECNVLVADDKIALWYQEERTGDIEYILGPVVPDFDGQIEDGMVQVTLSAGKYAIFETDRSTDEADVAEILRMYTRCVFFGWVKEHRERVDLTRITFERYENGKIYLYVPVKF